MEKICIKCEEKKELDKFDKREKSKDGYRNQCIKCLTNISKNRIEKLSEEEKIEYRKKRRERGKKYRENNMENEEFRLKEKNRRRKYHLKRLDTDPLYRLRISYSRRINKCIKKFNIKNIHFLNNLGCSLEDLKIYIESKFETWMTWDNYGKYNGELNYGWDIDHIMPISSAKTEEEFHELCHYENLQPLCSRINRDIKKNKIENPQ
jgi:hypothetical protein